MPSSALPYSLVSADSTTVNVVSTAAQTTVFSKQFSGGFFTPNSGIRIKVAVSAAATTTTATGSTLNVNYNGVSVAALGLTSVTALQSNGADNISGMSSLSEIVILNQNSLSSQKYFILNNMVVTAYILHASTAGSTVIPGASGFSGGTSTVDFSQPGLLEITLTNSNAQANTFTYQSSIIEKIG